MNDAAIAVVLLAGACAVALAALAMARLLRVPRLLDRLLHPLPPSEASTIETLVALAGLARCEGLLIVEQHTALARLPVFHHGLGLILAGHRPAAIREQLAMEAASAPRYTSLFRFIKPLGIAAAAAALAALLAAGAEFNGSRPAALMLAMTLIAAAMAITFGDQAAPALHERRLATAMQIEAAAMIAAGSSAAEVRAVLLAMQSPSPHRAILGRAA